MKLIHKLGYATPKRLTLFLNRSCNMRCPKCLYLLYDKNFFDNSEMDMNDAKYIIRHYRKIKSLTLVAEGEVFLYKGLDNLIEYARSVGYKKITFTTNGLIYKLISIKSFTISFDGYDEETYKERRGNYFNKVVGNIERYVNSGKIITLNCVLIDKSYIEPMIKLAEKIRVKRIRFAQFNPINEKPYICSFDDYKHLLDKTDWKIDITLPPIEHKNNWCSILYEGITIGAKGDFTPCCQMLSHHKYGNVLIDPKAYNKREILRFRRSFPNKECGNCPRLSPVRYHFSRGKWSVE